MIYHDQHPALPTGGGLGLVSPWPLMKFRGRGPMGLRVPLHLLPLRTHRGIAPGISLKPLLCLLIPLPVRPLQLLPVHGEAL
ncbi:hypothetical protein PBY51_010620 [Eleginops maclovinus]|uniref:Uncharacterized protein n=1 Tax=Eleginops maclovinus TaxID=56733 RepID=A0AAN8AEV9_ELEMC|nr:hypothetical protein PBY51_010620 [Eleginops maclovinus]